MRPSKVLGSVPFAAEFLDSYSHDDADFHHIRVVMPRSIDAMEQAIMVGRRIGGAGRMGDVSAFVRTLTSLDLADNLFGPGLAQVAEVLRHVPNLTYLSLSNNALAPEPGHPGGGQVLPALGTLRHLRLSNTGLLASTAAEWTSRLEALEELHFCGNSLETAAEVGALAAGLGPGLRTLFLNENRLGCLSDVLPLRGLPGLRTLSVGGNPLTLTGFLEDARLAADWGREVGPGAGGADDEDTVANPSPAGSSGGSPPASFAALESLYMSETHIDDLASLDALRALPALRDVRVSSTPLVRSLPGEDTFKLLVAMLPGVETLNGSKVTDGERSAAERALLRHLHSAERKPRRYWELAAVHGEVAPLADVDLSPPPDVVRVRLDLFGEEERPMEVPTRWRVMRLAAELGRATGVHESLLRLTRVPADPRAEREVLMFPGLPVSRYEFSSGDTLLVEHAKYGLARPGGERESVENAAPPPAAD